MRNQFRFLIVIFLIISLLAGCSTTGEQTTGRTVGTGAGAIAGAAIGAKKHGATGASWVASLERWRGSPLVGL